VTDVARVRVLGTGLRTLCGGRELSVEAGHVRALLVELCSRGGDELTNLLFGETDEEGRALHPDLRVLVNGRDVSFLAGLDTSLDASDSVTLHQTGARSFPGG
jgi:molybdopterin converting factor small subunit